MSAPEPPPETSLVLYQTEDGRTRIQCRFDQGTIWLTQIQIAELFQTSVPNINLHLRAIYEEGELDERATIKSYLIVRAEGARQVTRSVLPEEKETQKIFQIIQNKLHFAATGKTAPELIAERADATRANMGLTAWKGGVVRKGDVTIAKNYLREEEITELNRIVVMFLDFAEDQARRKKQVFLKDWQSRLDEFLRFNEREVLPNAGAVSREDADRKAREEYDRFASRRREHLEAEGEEAAMRQLEQAAKTIPKQKKK